MRQGTDKGPAKGRTSAILARVGAEALQVRRSDRVQSSIREGGGIAGGGDGG